MQIYHATIILKNRLIIVFAYAYPLLYLLKIVCRVSISHDSAANNSRRRPYKVRCVQALQVNDYAT